MITDLDVSLKVLHDAGDDLGLAGGEARGQAFVGHCGCEVLGVVVGSWMGDGEQCRGDKVEEGEELDDLESKQTERSGRGDHM